MRNCLVGRVRTTLTNKQFNFKDSQDGVQRRKFAIQTRPIRMRKVCLFSMSKRYAYDENNNLETHLISVL